MIIFQKRLLGLEFTSNHSIKSKSLKWTVKKITARLQRMKNTQSKKNLIKTGKKSGTTSCLGCEDYIHNFKPQEIKMTNKVLKSNCVACRSNKSRFLKQKHNKK